MAEIRVIHWGLGAMGGGMVRLVARKPGLRSVAAVDRDPRKVGRDLGEVAGMDERLGVKVSGSLAEATQGAGRGADVVLLSIASFTREVYPAVMEAVEAGLHVVTIAEEMAYPSLREQQLAKKMDDLARKKGVTVLGTGINPGFVLDVLVIVLTGACQEVRKIRAARVNDLSPFGSTVMRTQGVGTTPDEFQRGLESGAIVGHIGFPESMTMIAEAIGWRLDRIEQEREPIISKVHRETPHGKVEPGMVAGCRHIARGFLDGREVITLEHPQQILPELEGVETGDFIWIEGTPDLNFAGKPEIPGGLGTIALAVNSIPAVMDAEPGLVTMADLPVPRAIMGDLGRARGRR
ncbi:MAG: 2,4-diaminopentanoate dehydrogenase [Bacillota bacterium]